MNTKLYLPFRRNLSARSRGSALIAVIFISAAALLFAGSILRLSLTERKLTIRNALVLESRNAAEALAEYGFAQIRQKFETRTVFDLDPKGADAIAIPSASFWTNSNVNTGSGTFELLGGTVEVVNSPGSSYYYVDPRNPNNDNDPLKGKWVWRRDVSVLARASVSHGTGGDVVSHAGQTISVRGAPLFAHAIFYNMDLEISPGPEMNIRGPVHTNGNLYLVKQGGDNTNLNFYGQVTASGNFFRAWKHGVAGANGVETTGKGDIRFVNASGGLIGIKKRDSEGKIAYNAKGELMWNDSYLWDGMGDAPTSVSNNFRTFASQTWQGNLLTASHGITDYRPVAIGEYLEPDPLNPNYALKDAHKDVAERRTPSNAGRLIIEPSNWPTDPTDPNYSLKKEVETQKFSNNAGIYIQVQPPVTDGGSPTITAISRSKLDPTKTKTLTLPDNLVNFQPYSSEKTTNNVAKTRRKLNAAQKLLAGIVTPGDVWELTTTETVTIEKATALGVVATDTKTVTKEFSSTRPNTSNVTTVTGSVDSGLFDQRRNKGVNLVDIDMDALRKAVASMAGTTTKLSDGTTVTPTSDHAVDGLTEKDWTGIIYVEVLGAPSTDSVTGATKTGAGADATAAAVTAVRVINGKGKAPSHGSKNEGLTIATNAPMYVQGHFNADGSTSTANATHSASVPESGEVPAALVADAITILSEGFDLKKSLTTNKPNVSGTTEISAALLMGITPTNPTIKPTSTAKGASSGGAHNFPRFLEHWQDKSLFLRGSLVALFESRIATEPFNLSYYSPPKREWGFNDLFALGRFPPGTPSVMSYRRVNFEYLDQTTYAALKEDFGWDK